MTPNETTNILRQLHEWLKNETQWAPTMGAKAVEAAIKVIDRMENMKTALEQHHRNAMCEGLDPSHPLTKLRVSFYQETDLYADTIAALEESK